MRERKTGKKDTDKTSMDVASKTAAPGHLRVHHIVTLAYLLSKGAGHNYIGLTTTDLGRGIKKSQQSASRHLADLERDGFVERGTAIAVAGRQTSVRVTRRGLEAVMHISSILQDGIRLAGSDDFSRVKLAGVLVSGMGEGAYYMALDGYTRQFHSKVGYVPFPGTLNIRLLNSGYRETVGRLKSERAGMIIENFSDGLRTYGWAKCLPALLRADDTNFEGDKEEEDKEAVTETPSKPAKTDGIRCELIILERTHHDDSIIELISEHCLREAASISDGSRVTVEILSDDER